MSKRTIRYTNQEGADSFALLSRMTHVEGTEQANNCQIHIDTGDVIQTRDNLFDLRTRVETAYALQQIEKKDGAKRTED